jgi:hypothetical protein
MSILKSIVSSEGVTLNYHKILKIETLSRPATLAYTIRSWQNEADYMSGKAAVTTSRDEIDVPSDLMGALDDLVLTGSKLTGGTFLPDNLETLEGVKLRCALEIKRARDVAINGGFTWDSSSFDSDPISQTRILGAFVSAQEQTWRLSDNTWRVLSAVDIQAVWVALQNHMKDNFIKFAMKEAEIASAIDNAAVALIVW